MRALSAFYLKASAIKASVWQVFVIVFLHGLSSALPFGLITLGVQNWYLTQNQNLTNLAWLSLIAQVYLFKFLWGHVCDNHCLYGTQKRKSWILTMQAIMVLLIALLSFISFEHRLGVMIVIALIGFASATQDLCIDAYRSELMTHHRLYQKYIALSYIVGFRLGYLMTGAGILLIAHFINWQFSYQLIAGCMMICMLATIYSTEHSITTTQTSLNRWQAIQTILAKKHIKLFLSFIFLYEFGDSLISAVLVNFLASVKHYSLLTIALQVKTANLISLFLSPIIMLVFLNYASLSTLLLLGLVSEALILNSLWYASDSMSILFWSQLALGLFEGMLGALILNVYTYLADGESGAFNYAFIAAVGGLKSLVTPSLAVLIIKCLSWPMLFLIGTLLTLPGCYLVILLRPELKKIF